MKYLSLVRDGSEGTLVRGYWCIEVYAHLKRKRVMSLALSAPRKAQAVLRLLRGEDLELLSRELGIVAFTLSLWREEFLAAGQAALQGKTGRTDVRDEQIGRLKKKIGKLTMENELLQEKTQRLEAGLPLADRRSRRSARPARSPPGKPMACNVSAGYGRFCSDSDTKHLHRPEQMLVRRPRRLHDYD